MVKMLLVPTRRQCCLQVSSLFNMRNSVREEGERRVRGREKREERGEEEGRRRGGGEEKKKRGGGEEKKERGGGGGGKAREGKEE